jgi:hypothetical protein
MKAVVCPAGASAGNDRGGQRDPMVLGPRRSRRCPRSAEHFADSLTISSIRRRSTTSWPADAETATARPR